MMVEQNVAVIGGGSGLGREIVLEELKNKNNVTIFTSNFQNRIQNKNISYYNADFSDFDEQLFNKVFSKKNISKVYFCSVIAKHEKFKNCERVDIEKQIKFNITNVSLFIHFLINKSHNIKLIFILSHVCFIFSPGFAIYRMNKRAIEDLLLSIEIENPHFFVSKVYPGAMDTDFVKNTKYKGLSYFRKKSPKWWAKKIVYSKRKKIISNTDLIIQVADYIIPFFVKKWIYKNL